VNGEISGNSISVNSLHSFQKIYEKFKKYPTIYCADLNIEKFNTIPAAVTRGNRYKIRQDHVRYLLFVNFALLIESELCETVCQIL